MMHAESQIGLLMGPTGSGKSAMALAIAKRRPTVIINADAMQLVSALRIITARPTVDEEAQAEHALYGVLPAASPTSVAVWLELVAPVISRAWEEGKLPLLVGGTGMYIKALMDGLAVIPEIPEEVRVRVRSYSSPPCGGRLGGGGSPFTHSSMDGPPTQPSPARGEGLYQRLQQRDPLMAAQLKPGDTQRILRALEVIEATGVSLFTWQQQKTAPLFPQAVYNCYYLDVPRQTLYDRLDARFLAMMGQGALAEVEALLALNLPPDTPILRAHGVPELAAYLAGTMKLDAAIAQAQQHTRNYAKRQMTWIRNQLPEAVAIKPDENPVNFMKL